MQKIEGAGYLGRKNQQGFYDYHDKKNLTANKAAQAILPKTSRTADHNDWQRLMMLMVAEATRCLEEQVVASPDDIDTGMVFGTGFPPFRGGLCRWADQLPEEIRKSAVNELAGKYGERFTFSDEYRHKLEFYSR